MQVNFMERNLLKCKFLPHFRFEQNYCSTADVLSKSKDLVPENWREDQNFWKVSQPCDVNWTNAKKLNPKDSERKTAYVKIESKWLERWFSSIFCLQSWTQNAKVFRFKTGEVQNRPDSTDWHTEPAKCCCSKLILLGFMW